ncbi:MAG: alpha/beta fold hydrolase [Actinobacteria bacterium]|nr:alpha/beta fold hydrolase [Actinomycetota bacterium]
MTTNIMPGCEPFSVSGGRDGVLVLHGFTGNPQSMRPLAEAIANAGYTVELPRLPGHGTTVEDMMTTGWADWSGAADAAYRELATRCDRVAVVGLSMGGGLTAFVAEEHPDVTALVFINALVKPPVQEMRDGLKGLLDAGMETMESIGSDIKKEGSQEASYNATPLACAASLFDGIEKVWERLDTISAPTLILSSREDHVVSSDNSEDLARIVTGSVEHIWLEDSYHVATLDNDASIVEAHTVRFLDSIFSA